MSQIQIQSVTNTNTRVQYTNAKLSWGQTRVTPLVGEAHRCHRYKYKVSQIKIQEFNTQIQNYHGDRKQTHVTPLVGEAHKCHQLVNTLDSHPALKKKKNEK